MSAAPPAEEIVQRALCSPFARPSTSVVLVGDRELELVELDALELGSSRVRVAGAEASLSDACKGAGLPVEALRGRRTPVLAYGSNASPSGMRWKFADA